MKDIYRKLATHLEIPEILEGRAPLEEIWSLLTPPVQEVSEFFRSQYPVNGIEGHLRISPIEDVIRENHDTVPGVFANPYGFLVFGTTLCGDAICTDGASGAVLILPHDAIDDESVCFGWNEETEQVNEAPLSRESLYQVATERFESIKAFFEDWIAKVASP